MFEYLERVENDINFSSFAIPEAGYVRHLIEKTEEHELYCITWSVDAETPFHGHPAGGCWMRVVEGELKEITVLGERILKPGDTGFQKGLYGVHKIVARKGGRSLHLYKPGILQTN